MNAMHDLVKSISDLEVLAKQRLKSDCTEEFARLTLLLQLSRYGVCTCHCHFSDSVYHGAAPCCGNAKLAPEI